MLVKEGIKITNGSLMMKHCWLVVIEEGREGLSGHLPLHFTDEESEAQNKMISPSLTEAVRSI